MFTKIYIFISYLSILVLFSACKKYQDDDRYYLTSVKGKLSAHDWLFNKMTVNDVDSTTQHAQLFGTNPHNIKFKINKDIDNLILKYPNVPNSYLAYTFQLSDSKNEVFIGQDSSFPEFFRFRDVNFKILKLTDECFNIQMNKDGLDVTFEFIK